MKLRTPVKQARGLGSAKEGVAHWWVQRASAVGLIFLTVWFVPALLTLISMDYTSVLHWTARPLNAILLILLLAATFYHSYLGVQVVIEDYVHVEWLKIASLLLLQFLHIGLAATGIFAVLRIAFGAN